MRNLGPLLALMVVASAGCSAGAPGATPAGDRQPQVAGSEASRTLVIAVGRAPESLASKPLRETRGAGSPRTTQRAFNAGLVLNDDKEIPRRRRSPDPRRASGGPTTPVGATRRWSD